VVCCGQCGIVHSSSPPRFVGERHREDIDCLAVVLHCVEVQTDERHFVVARYHKQVSLEGKRAEGRVAGDAAPLTPTWCVGAVVHLAQGTVAIVKTNDESLVQRDDRDRRTVVSTQMPVDLEALLE